MKVTYIDHMGTDLSVVNAARVSFGKASEWEKRTTAGYPVPADVQHLYVLEDHLPDKDKALIRFLARGCTSGDWESLRDDIGGAWLNGYFDDFDDLLNHVRRMPSHWTPFGHTSISLHMKVPLFVARQIHKHQVGFVVNEVSRRYVDEDPEFYVPDVWRKRADNVKQGSSDEGVTSYAGNPVTYCHNQLFSVQVKTYREMLEKGVCPEQARMVLPQSMYTEFWMTGNLYGWANLYNQRIDSHAQRETQTVAKQVGEVIAPLFPVSWAALTQ